MQKKSIIEISQNDTSQVVGGFGPGKIDDMFLVAAGVGAVGGIVVTGAAMWIMHRVMANSRAKVEEQLKKEQNNTVKFCEYAKQIHEQCLDLAHNKVKKDPKDEL